ncbi:hypothetical protein COL26b_010255 [Colletotrichum chrysophilum]|uniref:uncharacterized protein n=1 Tax=Colletotrichum chrysophilum TaxID=1836956 RepID=UPI002300AF62|nr:uncharacterized protein COL26b_010255 [Colletotrichum chrysophilum]KAJ0370051.1 hypothetical protein COL26b_010255 [Colletotrichum chrysophilum]
MFAFFKQYLRSRPAPTSSILGATGRYDFLDDDLSIRRDIIQDIHRLLQANTALLKKENRGDVAKPGDNSRPVMFNSRDVINQARFCAALWSLERLRLDAIHRSLSANEDGFPGDLMESLGMVHERLVRDRINAANNIIYLSRELQKLWDQGVFALEPLGYDSRPKEREAGASVEHLEKEDLRHCLELRFHWLPKTSVQNLRETASPDLLNTSPRDLIQEFETNEGPQADIGRCINSGEIITIWADRRKDLPAIEFLRARWLACLIHRFSGSADPKIYEPLFPNSDDICATCSMLRDAAELPKLRERLADLELRVKNRMADV